MGSRKQNNLTSDASVLSRRDFLRVSGSIGAATSFAGGLSSQATAVAPAAEALGDLPSMSAGQLAQAIRDRTVSSSEVVGAYLDRISDVNPRINAVVQVNPQALDQAREADEALARGEIRGPLHGVPITIKDSFDTAGLISTAGTRGRAGFVPTENATAVARLLDAGAIVLGKTNTPELTLSFETDNLIYGRTNNPYDPTRTPGGSSGGAAAILAMGGSALDVGSDTGGSIRMPSHFCGIAGLKPTQGRVSRSGHVITHHGPTGGITHIGPLARSVSDLFLALPILAGVDWNDPEVVPMPDPNSVDLNGLRVAFYSNDGIVPADGSTANAITNAAAALTAAGSIVEEARPPGLGEVFDLWLDLLYGDGGDALRTLLDESGTALNEVSPAILELLNFVPGRTLTVIEFNRLLTRWSQFKSEMLGFLENRDIILCPVHLSAAPFHGGISYPGGYAVPYNLTGWPVGVVRVSTSNSGLPIGVQIVGRPWREDVVLAVAQQLETVFGGWQPVPGPALAFQRADASLELSWKEGKLQAAEDIQGPWNEVTGASSPHSVNVSSRQKEFFRLKR